MKKVCFARIHSPTHNVGLYILTPLLTPLCAAKCQRFLMNFREAWETGNKYLLLLVSRSCSGWCSLLGCSSCRSTLGHPPMGHQSPPELSAPSGCCLPVCLQQCIANREQRKLVIDMEDLTTVRPARHLGVHAAASTTLPQARVQGGSAAVSAATTVSAEACRHLGHHGLWRAG